MLGIWFRRILFRCCGRRCLGQGLPLRIFFVLWLNCSSTFGALLLSYPCLSGWVPRWKLLFCEPNGERLLCQLWHRVILGWVVCFLFRWVGLWFLGRRSSFLWWRLVRIILRVFMIFRRRVLMIFRVGINRRRWWWVCEHLLHFWQTWLWWFEDVFL